MARNVDFGDVVTAPDDDSVMCSTSDLRLQVSPWLECIHEVEVPLAGVAEALAQVGGTADPIIERAVARVIVDRHDGPGQPVDVTGGANAPAALRPSAR